jgi:type IVB pilus formation R64 PilN family outer membrane protein
VITTTKKYILVALFGSSILVGCQNSNIRNNNDAINSQMKVVDQHLLEIKSRALSSNENAAQSNVRIHAGSWIPTREVTLKAEDHPGLAIESKPVVINGYFDSIHSALDKISTVSGVKFRILDSQVFADSSGNKAHITSGIDNLPSSSLTFVPIESTSFAGQTSGFKVAYNGSLKGLLDSITSRFNVYWEWDDGATLIEVFRVKTKTFRINALLGYTNISNTITGSGDGDEDETGVEAEDISVWESLEQSISSMLSKEGSVTVTPATGTVTVTDTPSSLSKIESFIDQQNDALATQVVVNVRVLSVEISDEDNYGIDWDLAFKDIAGTYGITLSSAFDSVSSASNLGMRILSDTSNPNASINRWSGSQAVFSALSEQANVSQMTSAAVTTLNNQPVPIRVGRTQAYLASTETSVSDSTVSATLTPGEINTGFNMSILPHITSDRSLLLQFGVELSSLLSLNTFTSGDSTIQVPQTENRKFLQRVRINSGETLVVAGFENSDMTTQSRGVGNAANRWLGGGSAGSSTRNAIVVLIQPIIID